MKRLWSFISKLGIYEDMDLGIQKRVTLANQFSAFFAILILVLFCYSFLIGRSSAGDGEGTWVIYTMFFTAVTVLFLNGIGFHKAGRFIMSIAPALLMVANSFWQKLATTLTLEMVSYVDVRILLVSFSVLPWVFFSIKERLLFISSIIITLLPVLFFDSIHEMFGAGYQQLGLSSEVYKITPILTMFAIGVALGLVYFLMNVNASFEETNKELLASLQIKNQEFQESEDKLKVTLEEVVRAREEEDKRRWVSDGIAKMSDIVRKNSQLKPLCDELISNLVKYMAANQGGIFVLRQEIDPEFEAGAYLELISAYAYERHKYTDKKIALGEGLVGQVFIEKKQLYTAELPEDYIKITSGLGDAPPQTLLIFPLINNEIVEGVVEIASFKEMKGHHFDFIKSVSEVFAAAIANFRISEQTQKLLEEAQEQREMLRAQEEEMRQNVEELEATQEEMRRVQQRLSNEKKAAEEKIAELENLLSLQKSQ